MVSPFFITFQQVFHTIEKQTLEVSWNCTAVEILFHHSETYVSPQWKFCFTAVKQNFVRGANSGQLQGVFIHTDFQLFAQWSALWGRTFRIRVSYPVAWTTVCFTSFNSPEWRRLSKVIKKLKNRRWCLFMSKIKHKFAFVSAGKFLLFPSDFYTLLYIKHCIRKKIWVK